MQTLLNIAIHKIHNSQYTEFHILHKFQVNGHLQSKHNK